MTNDYCRTYLLSDELDRAGPLSKKFPIAVPEPGLEILFGKMTSNTVNLL
jgi:hypothetical protein